MEINQNHFAAGRAHSNADIATIIMHLREHRELLYIADQTVRERLIVHANDLGDTKLQGIGEHLHALLATSSRDIAASINALDEADIALSPGSDDAILQTFRRWQETLTRYSELPIDAPDPDWGHASDLEEQVMQALAFTPAGIAAKLWMAFHDNQARRDDELAARRADLGYFGTADSAENLAWSDRIMLSALRSLAAIGGSLGPPTICPITKPASVLPVEVSSTPAA